MNRLKFSLVIIISLLGFCFCAVSNLSTKPWMRTSMSPEERAQTLLSAMTTEEKLTMLHGTSGSYVGNVAGNERLGIPSLNLQDGPQGVRDDQHPGTSTCWPATLSVGATWDKELAYKWGKAMSKEFYGKGANVLLGPGLNLARVPVNGRNFEYMSGGDPFLGYSMVQPLVKGIQSEPIIANAKHWINNNQENDRSEVSANDDERTRHELYYQPFLGAIEAGVGSFMCSYNKINDIWSCENNETLNTDLKGHLKFNGWVMSDWGATHSVSVDKGLDQEMPGSDYFGSKLSDLVNSGEIEISVIDNAVLRILTPMFKVGLFDTVNTNTMSNIVTSEDHNQFARELSSASHVLLKNDKGLLPLRKDSKMKIALFGKSASEPVIAGGGSGSVFPPYVISPYRGLMDALNIPIPDGAFTYSCNSTNLMKNFEIHQWGCQSAPASSVEECCEKCGKFSGCHFFTFSGNRCSLYPTGNELRPTSSNKTTGECKKTTPAASWQCNDVTGSCVALHDGSDLKTAQSLAKEADVVIVAVSQFSREGSDRDDLSFDVKMPTQQCQVVPTGQNDLVSAVAAVGKPTIVAAVAPGAVIMPWKDQVQSILFGFLPGQEYGHALADVLFGDVNPSAKLPMTLPNVENEVEFSRSQYPGIQKQSYYTEKLLIDYRWYTTKNVTPAFGFGHGLSYTTFDFSDITVSPFSASITITNNGDRSGSEVVQFYLTFPQYARTPPLQLKGFVKTSLQVGESQKVTVHFTKRDLSVWDVDSHDWKFINGDYIVSVGSSSTDLKLTATMSV